MRKKLTPSRAWLDLTVAPLVFFVMIGGIIYLEVRTTPTEALVRGAAQAFGLMVIAGCYVGLCALALWILTSLFKPAKPEQPVEQDGWFWTPEQGSFYDPDYDERRRHREREENGRPFYT